MSNFQPPHAKIAWIERRLNALESMVRRNITPQGVISSGTVAPIGIPFTHTHTGTSQGGLVDASPLTYTPAVLANWTGSADPGGVKDALDQLASRTTTIEGGSTFLLLAGRAGGQTAKGGTAASENLTLQSTAHATRGVIAMADSATIAGYLQITSAAANPRAVEITGTYTTAASSRHMEFTATVTMDYALGTAYSGIVNSDTINFKQVGGAIAMHYGFLNNPTIQPAAAVNPGPIHDFVADTTYNALNAYGSLTLPEWDGFRSHQQITATGTGTVAITAMNMFRGQLRAFASGSTITTLRGFLYENFAAGGTVTTQIGLDVEALSGATNNYAIRVANTVQVNSGAALNIYSDVATTLTGTLASNTGTLTINRILMPVASATFSGVPFYAIQALQSGMTATLDTGATAWRSIAALGTIKYKVAGSVFGQFTMVWNSATFINDAAVSVTPGPIYTINDSPTITIDTATSKVMSEYITVLNNPTVNRANSGTMTITDMNMMDSRATIGAGITITTRRGVYFRDATNSGTLTTQVGVDIAVLAAGTNNFGIRNADRSVQTKYARFGSVTAGSNITDGDISALRAAFGTDAAIPAGGAILFINNPTIGNDVARFTSIATNDDPTAIIIQNRLATTDGTTQTLHTFTVPTSTVYMIRMFVIARRTGGSGGTTDDMAGYVRTGTYQNNAGTTALVGAISNDFTAEDQAAWDCTLTTTGSGTVVAQVTGAANNNVTWHMTATVMALST